MSEKVTILAPKLSIAFSKTAVVFVAVPFSNKEERRLETPTLSILSNNSPPLIFIWNWTRGTSSFSIPEISNPEDSDSCQIVGTVTSGVFP